MFNKLSLIIPFYNEYNQIINTLKIIKKVFYLHPIKGMKTPLLSLTENCDGSIFNTFNRRMCLGIHIRRRWPFWRIFLHVKIWLILWPLGGAETSLVVIHEPYFYVGS